MPRRKNRTELPALALADPDSVPHNAPGWHWEIRARESGARFVAGVDEAGRGPLAGPVVVAAVILVPECHLPGLNDSKQVGESLREELFDRIQAVALAYAVVAVEAEEIDRINILRATHVGMARALAGLNPAPDHALVDGLPVPHLPCPHEAIVKGDARCISIAAASILAKVTRDRLMLEMDRLHPGYGLAGHKGYPTPAHLRALSELGPAPCHRRSFRPVAVLLQNTVYQPSLLDGAGAT